MDAEFDPMQIEATQPSQRVIAAAQSAYGRARWARFCHVLELWQMGNKSTHCIARELDMSEADVCAIIRDSGWGR